MNLFALPDPDILAWLLRASWQAAVLAGLILLVQAILGKRLTPAWRYRLWLLVVVRLVLPFQAPSPTSVHNLARLTTRSAASEAATPLIVPAPPIVATPLPSLATLEARTARRESGGSSAEQDSDRATSFAAKAGLPTSKPTAAAPRDGRFLVQCLAWIWLAGALVLGVRIVIQNLRFARRLRRDGTSVSDSVAERLETCRKVLGVRTSIRALETDHVQSPAVYGLFRPTLLLPRGLAAEFSPDQLRFVLLHEVAHVKRGDTVMTWVMAVLQALHWFNPVVWLAFARMRVDRELACDALVLSCSRDEETAGYGETILRLLEVMNRGHAMPGLVGILEDKQQIRERIQGIASFRRPGRASASALLVLLVLGWVGLTDAASTSKPMPRVVPLHLTNLLVQAENRAWLEEPAWKAQPRGSNVFGGIEFHLDGIIRLQGAFPESDAKTHRDRVVVPLVTTNGSGPKTVVVQHGTNVGSLHFIGATAYDAPLETKIAEVVWRYTDGSFKRTPIQYAVQVRDGWRTRFEQPARVLSPHAKVVWRGTHPDAARNGRTLRLYRFSLANPEPQRSIRQLELVSARARATLIVLAMTLDPLKPGERPDNTADLEEIDPEPNGHLWVTVQNGQSQPLPGVQIRVRVKAAGESDPGIALTNVFTTDAQGLADVLWPTEGTERLQIHLSKPEFSARTMAWDLKTGDTIPTTHTVQMRSALKIGGSVVDPDGNPIAGANVVLSRYWMGGERRLAKGDDVDFERQEHTTGADGRWSAGSVPPEILTRISVSAKHPDFLNARVIGDPTRETLERLTNQTHVLTLLRGLDARGRVVNEQDQPIADATVWLGGRDTVERQETKTDADGRFTCRNVKEEKTLFSVLARSYAPADQYQKVQADMPDVVFRLAPGAVVRGRVENARGEPLAGARVQLEGNGNIGRTYEFGTRTDDNGRFEWDGAPKETMQFYLHAPGYEQKRNHSIPPDQDNVIVLRTKRRVLGQVVDAESGAPLTRFRLASGQTMPGLRLPGMSDSFLADYPGLNDHTAADGRFELELDEEETNAIQAEAEDHATTVENLPAAQDDVVNLTVRLKPSSGLRARVVDAAGRPVGGVSVTVVGSAMDAQTRHQAAQFKAGRFSVQWREGVVTTTDDGSFSLLSPPLAGWVHAANEIGFASLPLAAVRSSGQLVLQPYGRIEGTLTVLGQPQVGEEFLLGLSPMGLQADFNLHRVTTDAQGRFVFEQVPPGNVTVVRLIKTTPTSWTYGQQTPVQVEPGQTARIVVGNAGVVVQGRARLENPPTGEEWILNGYLQTRGPTIPASFQSPAEAEAFFATPEWVEHQKTQKHYPVKVAADGSLLLDSVVPGIYTLTVNADVPGDQPWNTKTIATGMTEVTVPAESDPLVPVQVTELVLKPIPPAK
ncbi:MAG: carboxypeptidase regulatory-like domain-containing protein [Verrucomicrobiales bacterium]|nr:carboxypeptidase regulatory-like domain-containing protein [Verrucomicrobiales bacterium]